MDNFDQHTEMLDSYLERTDQYYIKSDIGQVADGANQAAKNAVDEKVANLISDIGKDVYGVFQNLSKPQKPCEKTFDELRGLLRGHYKQKIIEVAELFKFYAMRKVNNNLLQTIVLSYV